MNMTEFIPGHDKPTLRIRWKYFYRLFRIAVKGKSKHTIEYFDVLDCFSTLGYNKWVRSLDASNDLYADHNFMPLFLRQREVEVSKARRLLKAIMESDDD